MLTRAEQDYIKAIYRLEEAEGFATTTSLAGMLGVRAASVSGMLKKLGQEELIRRRTQKGVCLTESGRMTALEVLRRHRLIELFLVDILGMEWESVHQEAEKMEHAVSDEVVARIDKLLGYPKFDPHGAPIPSQRGTVDRRETVRLDQLPSGGKGTVCEVNDGDSEMLKHLKSIGLVPGAEVDVIELIAVDGTRVVSCNGRELNVSRKVASAVRIGDDCRGEAGDRDRRETE